MQPHLDLDDLRLVRSAGERPALDEDAGTGGLGSVDVEAPAPMSSTRSTTDVQIDQRRQ
ncbi:hypothetical protein BZL30_3823 [Mycobacterium kansasii]|uniref:Uncharacterized protein n=1 Tax=Mycobacterium kansasii TaxID=1768 RepID=A0A1V3XAV8_MYCKA|nr:hypothetical protein BZL30_3823 [Mycobacterium kansasii]